MADSPPAPPRILIIDDQPANVRLLTRMLRSEGYQDLHPVTDPRLAISTFEKVSPDLVLLDLMMSPVSGREVLDAIRASQAPEAYLPVLVLTADVNIETRRAALAAGATDFLTKPLDTLEVALRIRNLLKTRSLHLELQRHNRDLEETVRARTRELAKQARMMDLASDAFLVRDLDERIIYWNKGAERTYGHRAEEAIGRDARELLCRDATEDRHVAQVVREQGEWSGELRHVRKDGQDIVVQSRRCLVRDEEGQPFAFFAVNTDVTDKKAIELQLQRTQRLESLGALAGGVAHDLNNMLTPILMGIGVLRGCVQDESGLTMLETMEKGAEAGRGLVKQLLTFVRGSGQQRRELLLGPYLREVISLLGKTFPRSVEILLDVPRDLWAVRMDVTQLYQVTMNLCINARDAMPEGGTLTVAAANLELDEAYVKSHRAEVEAGPHVVLSVSDTGVGIATEDLERIFEPFFTTKGPERGTGLGLSTTAAIVKAQGGFVEVTSRPGRGARFDVFLPAVAGVTAADGPAELVPPGGDGELILVVEDEAVIREIVRSTLETAGYRVLTAPDGTEAVALTARHGAEIRLALTDLVMPILDGPATIRAMHRLQPGLPIVILSGSGGSASEALPGVRARLAKPFTANDLLWRVREALDEEA